MGFIPTPGNDKPKPKPTSGGGSSGGGGTSGGTPHTRSTARTTVKSVDTSPLEAVYRILGIPVNHGFINKWKNRVNSAYEFKQMVKLHDKSYVRSQEYISQVRKMKLVVKAFFPTVNVKRFHGLLDTAVRKDLDATDLYYKLKGKKLWGKRYPGWEVYLKSEPGAITSPVRAAVEYQNYADVQKRIYGELGMAVSPKIQKAYFSDKVGREEAIKLASDYGAIQPATSFVYGQMPEFKQKDIYTRIAQAVNLQRSYLKSTPLASQQSREEGGTLVQPFIE